MAAAMCSAAGAPGVALAHVSPPPPAAMPAAPPPLAPPPAAPLPAAAIPIPPAVLAPVPAVGAVDPSSPPQPINTATHNKSAGRPANRFNPSIKPPRNLSPHHASVHATR